MRRLPFLVAVAAVTIGCKPPPPDAPPRPEPRSETTVTVIAPPPEAEPTPPPTVVPAPDLKAEAAEVLAQQVAALNAGDVEGFCGDWTEQALVLGPMAEHTFTSREVACEAVRSLLQGLPRTKVELKTERVGADGDAVAWSINDLLLKPKEGPAQLMRVGSVLVRQEDRVAIAAQSFGFSVPNAQTDALIAQRQFPAPKPFVRNVPAALSDVEQLIHKSFDPATTAPWFRLGERTDAMFSGTAPSEMAIGDFEVKKQVHGWFDAQQNEQVRATIDGPMHIAAHGDATVVAFHLEVLTAQHGAKKPFPLRMLQLFVAEGKNRRPVLSHASFGFEQL